MVSQRLVDIARSQVGVHEEGGENCGPKIREFQSATWLAPAAWPWCAAFCCWVLKKWLADPEVRQVLTDTVAPKLQEESWRCRDASAFGWEKWARNKGLPVLHRDDSVQPGDFVIFDFNGPVDGGGHIGIVTASVDGKIMTIEGNTNADGSREGDGVWEKTRTRRYVRCFVRIC